MNNGLRGTLETIAGRQHGVVSRQQLLAAGVSRHAIQNAVDSGRLRRLFPGVFVVGSAPLTPQSRASAALLHVGGDAALARTSALAAHGLVAWPNVVRVVQTRHFRSADPRVLVHRTRSLPALDVCIVDGLRTTRVARSLVDSSPDLGRVDLADVLARAMRRRVVSRSEVEEVLAARPNDPNTRVLRSILVTRGEADSGVELVFARAVERRGVGVVVNEEVPMPGGHRRRGDLVIASSKIVIQLDSDAFHTGERAAPDMKRDADWAAAGYVTLRVPPRRVRRELGAVVDEVLQVHSVRLRPPMTG